ncbi:unnamed protein product [Tetraodon nigroviridis]|uniref:(spotted green pufferfish) hypothetical protein n=1 Tax=Tetraodon nigroviridis TaxID=99883 RepID=Q4RLW5_TETNG|nr:unnamed protein product [Tetraodon nigroviridis]
MARVHALLLIPLLSDLGSAVHFYLPVNSVKCLREDLQENVLVAGEYELSEEARTTTDLKIIDSNGFLLYIRQNATKGRFSFTTEKQDKFELCFYSTSPMGSGKVPDQLVKLNVKRGVEARDRKETENWEKLTPLEAKMKEIEQLSQSIADSLVYFMKREKEMQSTNASTNRRVLFLSIISMAMPECAGHLAGFLPETLLQDKEADHITVTWPLCNHLQAHRLSSCLLSCWCIFLYYLVIFFSLLLWESTVALKKKKQSKILISGFGYFNLMLENLGYMRF